MANQAVTISVNANTTSALKAIQGLTNKQYSINLQANAQPLGKITGQLSEFNKSLDAANARVVAFGASAGAVMVVKNAFDALISSTINVQKSLKDIQVVINASDATMLKFGDSLFNIAKNTGQSFNDVAAAATELSRQGLGMEETLKRTNDALILSRLSGMSAAQSVDTLTASVNSFASQGVTAAQIVNKLANVDAAYAVSSKDLAEAISRVGASASQSGVSIDELIGLVTSAQQVTARGGAVIGNSFKTIFTRLERGKTQDLLETIGISTKDSEGRLKSSIQMLKDLANVYSSLDPGKQAEVAEKVGGVFQINILKAALGDLGKEYSIYSGAVNTSLSATDEAIQRNEQLNQTYAAQINRLKENTAQFAANAGQRLLGPSMNKLIGTGNGVLEGMNNADGSGVGAKIGQGILDGIGQVLAGPGLVLLGGILVKLLGDFSKFATGSVKELLGLNAASKEQAAIQASITAMLEKNPSLVAQITSQAKTQTDQAKILLGIYQQQTLAMQQQATLTSQLAKQLYTGGVRMGPQGVPITKTAAGYIPNFVNSEFKQEESNAKMLGAKNPRAKWGKGTIGGQRFIMNSEETEIQNFGKNGDSAVIPNYSAGYIPNFAPAPRYGVSGLSGQFSIDQLKAISKLNPNSSYGKNKNVSPESISSAAKKLEEIESRGDKKVVDLGFTNKLSLIYGKKGGISSVDGTWTDAPTNTTYKLGFNAAGLRLPVEPEQADLEKRVIDGFRQTTADYVRTLGGPELSKKDKNNIKFSNTGAIYGMLGNIFETAVTIATEEGFRNSETSSIDFMNPGEKLKNLFWNAPGAYEAKWDNNTDLRKSVVSKYVKTFLSGGKGISKKASGYIPNFAAAMQESISREMGAGVSENDIYIKRYGQLASPNNPQGYGVFNTRDEGTVSSEKRAMRNRGYATGYIPNFAEGDITGDAGSTVAAVGAELSTLVLMLGLNRKDLNQVFRKEIEDRKIANSKQLQAMQDNITQQEQALATAKNLSQKQRQNQLANIESLKQQFSQQLSATKSGTLDTLRAGVKASGSQISGAATVLGPIIASTIAASIDKSTREGRGEAAAISGAGNVVSGIAAGALAGGPIGAAIGGTISAFTALDSYIKEVNTSLPEYVSALNKATETQSRFQDVQSRLMQLTEKLQETRKQEGGVGLTKQQSGLISQINEAAGGLSPETRGKIMATNYEFESVRQILVEQAELNVKNLTQKQKETELVRAAEKGRQTGFFAELARFTGTSRDSEQVKRDFNMVSQKGTLQKVFGDIITLGVSGLSDEQTIADYTQGEKSAAEVAKILSEKIFQSAGGDVKKIEEMSKQFAKESASMSPAYSLEQLGDMAGFSAEAMKSVADAGAPTTSVLSNLALIGLQLAASQKKYTVELASFKEKFGPAIKSLEMFKSAMADAIENIKITATNIPEEQAFGYDFRQKRNVAMAESIGDMGLSEASRNLSIQNDFAETIGKAKFGAANQVTSDIIKILSGNMENLIPGGKPGTATSFEDNKKMLEEQVKILNEISGQGEGAGAIGEMMKTLTGVSEIKGKGVGTAFGTSQILDKQAIIQAVQNSPNFKAQYGGPNTEAAKQAIDKLGATIDQQNKEILSSERELAARAAQQIDQLIKIQLQQLQAFGGGIDQILSDSGPQAGKAAERAAIGYAQVQSNPFATDIQKGREALKTGKALNNMMGGVPVISMDSQIFKDTTSGIAEGLAKDWEATKSGLLRTKGGAEMVGKMEQETMKLTGAKDMQSAFGEIAKYQAAKALNLDTRETPVGKAMYEKRLASVKEKFGQTDEGKAAFAAYEKASAITEDPAAIATMSLEATMKSLIGQTNSLLQQRLVGTMPASPFTAAGSQLLEGVQNARALGTSARVGPQKEGTVSAAQFTHDFQIGINLPESAPGDPSMEGLSEQLNAAVQQAVDPILQDFYSEINKLKFQMNNDGQQPPPTETNAE